MLKLLVLLALTVPVLGQSNNFKPGSEPNGFHGLKWGSLPRKNMHRVQDPSLGRGFTKFSRPDDTLAVGKAPVESIEYGYLDGGLISVDIAIPLDSWFDVRDELFRRYGKVDMMFTSNRGLGLSKDKEVDTEMFAWGGKITGIVLTKYTINGGIECTLELNHATHGRQ